VRNQFEILVTGPFILRSSTEIALQQGSIIKQKRPQ
jgi:hypothetical protein